MKCINNKLRFGSAERDILRFIAAELSITGNLLCIVTKEMPVGYPADGCGIGTGGADRCSTIKG